jgi:alkylhydroperoxidase family enzyme
VTASLAARSGWDEAEVRALRDGRPLGEDKTDALVGVVREAAARSGQVSDAMWQRAAEAGWSSEQLAEAFAFLALTVFTAYFLNFAQTPVDLPGAPE